MRNIGKERKRKEPKKISGFWRCFDDGRKQTVHRGQGPLRDTGTPVFLR